jgi:hypothetical protein
MFTWPIYIYIYIITCISPAFHFICKTNPPVDGHTRILCLLPFSAAMERSLATPWVQRSYSFWFEHSNSTTPRCKVFKPKYRLCSPLSSKWRPGQEGIFFITSITTSVKWKFKRCWCHFNFFSNPQNGRSPTSYSVFHIIRERQMQLYSLFFFFVMVPATCLLFIFNITCTKRSFKS